MSNDESGLSKTHRNLLLCITGSVASIKLSELVRNILEKCPHMNICIIPTQNALKFIPNFNDLFNTKIPCLSDRLKIITKSEQSWSGLVFSFNDEEEWESWKKRDDPILHIELRKWADLCLIAPLDANTLAKISNGLCDNLLTSVIRAWDIESIKSKPIVICPAMNTAMYMHPITRKQLDLLANDFGFTIINPIEKTLMCGDKGVGAMAHVQDIAAKIREISLC